MEQIIRDILAGNTDSFRVIVREFSDDLLRIAYHFTRDWDDAKDVTQTTFIACFRNLRKYDTSRPFRPWLYRIHLNRCKSAARRYRRQILRQVALEEAHAVSEPTDSGSEAAILRHIAELPAKQKAAFILIEIENHTSQEAATMLGCADSTVRVHLARAKARLREQLAKDGIGFE